MEKFSKYIEIKSFECDCFGVLRLRSLFNYFQDMADEHANKMGLGYHFCIQKNLGWIGGAYHVCINRLPKWEEQLKIDTWPSDCTAVTGIRDFQISDKNGTVLVNASSQWVLVDLEKMRPVPVVKNIGSYEPLRERAVETKFPALDSLERIDNSVLIPVRFDDIDMNRHVNNAVYPSVCLDALDETYLQTHTLAEVSVRFKKPAKRQDKLLLKTQIDANETRHVLYDETQTGEFARVRLLWK
ncbi:MAG: acyl-[acyl-carrier-protein] thioesterase [Alphaproteobacteria bacterium]